jgi:LysM repeat protein
MVRFIWFLLLLLAGCALIFWPYQASENPGTDYSAFLDRAARPLARALPAAWQNAPELQARPLPNQPAAAVEVVAGACGGTVTVQRGDTLGKIAWRCGVPLKNLIAANTQLRDPNRIFAGQEIAIPGAGERGGIPDTSVQTGFSPGAVIEVEVGGLPPNQPVRIGLGLSSTGYRVLEQAVTGPDGSLVARVIIPASARPGDSAFLMATTQGVPARQAISATFTIMP